MNRLALACLVMLSLPMVSNAAEQAKDVKNSPEISVPDVGTLTTQRVGRSGFLATFKGVRPAAVSCSGRCGDRWSGSWTCPDGRSCYLNCSSNNPAQCN